MPTFEILEQPEIINPKGEEEEEFPDIDVGNEQFQKAQETMNFHQRQICTYYREYKEPN